MVGGKGSRLSAGGIGEAIRAERADTFLAIEDDLPHEMHTAVSRTHGKLHLQVSHTQGRLQAYDGAMQAHDDA